jgi:hypothetical protein
MTDEDDDRPLPVPLADYAMIAVAGCFSLCVLVLIGYLMLGGHPYAVLFPPENPAPAAPPAHDTPVYVQPEKPK